MKRTRYTLAAAAVVIVLGAAAIGWWLFPREREPRSRDLEEAGEDGFAEERPRDRSPRPDPNAPLRMAFLRTLGIDEEDREQIFRYQVDRGPEFCGNTPPREWLAAGGTVWLYAPNGLGKATLGTTEKSLETFGSAQKCMAGAPLKDLRSRRPYLVAAPHGHGAFPVRNTFFAEAAKDYEGWPQAIRTRLDAFWARHPAVGVETPDRAVAGTRVVVDSRLAAAWEIMIDESPVIYSTYTSLTRIEGTGEAQRTVEIVGESEQGWYFPNTDKLEPATGDCAPGLITAIFDLNRDGRMEAVFERAVHDGPTMISYCEWRNGLWKRVD